MSWEGELVVQKIEMVKIKTHDSVTDEKAIKDLKCVKTPGLQIFHTKQRSIMHWDI